MSNYCMSNYCQFFRNGKLNAIIPYENILYIWIDANIDGSSILKVYVSDEKYIAISGEDNENFLECYRDWLNTQSEVLAKGGSAR